MKIEKKREKSWEHLRWMCLLTLVMISLGIKSQETWQKEFACPPARWCNHVIYGVGNETEKMVCLDLDSIKARGFKAVMLEPGYRMPHKYLSEGYFKMMAKIVNEAKKRGLKVWIIDEGKYPSGFAGGKFSELRPDLRMKALVPTIDLEVNNGDSISGLEIGDKTLSVSAISLTDRKNKILQPEKGKIRFYAGMADWKLKGIGWDYRTSQTRCVNDTTGAKTTKNSLMDYLNPEAVKQFLNWTQEGYKRYIGKEFGKTVLGFRCDEPDFTYIPYTDSIVGKFKQLKGYDPTPWLASLTSEQKTWKERLFKADFWDVWSRLFAKTYFKGESEWCKKNGMEMITHLNKDHDMAACIRCEGDLFRDLSQVEIPGIDAIWNQIWPDTINNYPKYASSVSHVWGKRRAFSESFAAYYNSPTLPEAKYILDYQMIRGINFFEFMFWSSGSKHQGWLSQLGMKGLNEYANRATWLMQQGKPGARVAVYYPVSTIWTGKEKVAEDVKTIANELIKNQIDFDYITDDALNETLTLKNGRLFNRSQQYYESVIIPSTLFIQKDAWHKIEEFKKQGGKILFWGDTPQFTNGRSFVNDTEPIHLPDDAYYEPELKFTENVKAALPRQEIILVNEKGLIPDTRPRKAGEPKREPINPMREVSYTRRITDKGCIVMLMNEGRRNLQFRVGIDEVGKVYLMNAETGEKTLISSQVKDDMTWIEMKMEPWQTDFLYIERGEKKCLASQNRAIGDGETNNTEVLQQTINHLQAEGGGTLVIDKGKYLTGALFFPRGVNLQINKDAEIISSMEENDFKPISTRFEGIERLWKPALLNFKDGKDVRISGCGIVEGQGVKWKSRSFYPSGRPRLICLMGCEGGQIEGIKLRNQASWGLHVLYSRDIRIKGLDIQAEHSIPSSDGIDIDSSKGIVISGCRIECNDDCISIKSGKNVEGRLLHLPSSDIHVSKCTFAYGHSGVAMGSEVSGDIYNILIDSCIAMEGNEHLIRFKSQPSRGGVIENVTFRDIKVQNASNIFDVIMRWRMVGKQEEKAPELTKLRNILIERVNGACRSMGRIEGDPDSPIEGMTIKDCHLDSQTQLIIKNATIRKIHCNF